MNIQMLIFLLNSYSHSKNNPILCLILIIVPRVQLRGKQSQFLKFKKRLTIISMIIYLVKTSKRKRSRKSQKQIIYSQISNSPHSSLLGVKKWVFNLKSVLIKVRDLIPRVCLRFRKAHWVNLMWSKKVWTSKNLSSHSLFRMIYWINLTRHLEKKMIKRKFLLLKCLIINPQQLRKNWMRCLFRKLLINQPTSKN